ncbi:MAG TPA: exonuclease SbcCD subunit D [Streptosporangiaceae bacterium]|nr:exonuclease SbcCD subunit D [Streptosporangiaceae bacterium]
MRLIHTSDWHLGRTLHGESLLEHQGVFLRWLLDQAVTRQVDAVLVAGDVYDRAIPSIDAVRLLDETLVAFFHARIPVVLTSGNHDSWVRLGFASRLSEAAGIHLRTRVEDIARPVILRDGHGQVGIYGIPYLLPDAVMADLGAERSHASVLAAARERIRADAAARCLSRTVVIAHALITGGQTSDSERDIRVGGVGDAPASALAGCSYLALGHLHGRQRVDTGGATTAGYSGSPLAFSFSEKDHHKSVTLAEIGGDGTVVTQWLPTPVPRPLREVRGRLDDLLARAGTDLADLAGAWVKAVLTDQARPMAPMERLRERWPHTIALDFQPEGGLTGPDADLARLAEAVDPVEICGLFVDYVAGAPPDEAQQAVLRQAVEAAQHGEAAA